MTYPVTIKLASPLDPRRGTYSKELFMRKIGIVTFAYVLCLVGASNADAEECNSQEQAKMRNLMSYLDKTVPNDANAERVNYVIKTLRERPCAPTVSVLVKFLDFRRPLSDPEETGEAAFHPLTNEAHYPAIAVLDEITEFSKSARSEVFTAVLNVIGSASSSNTARENAVAVWMFMHREEPARGVALLRKQVIRASDPAVKANFILALSKAQTRWCDPKSEASCKAAARMPKP
jgi:hypothetical protein